MGGKPVIGKDAVRSIAIFVLEQVDTDAVLTQRGGDAGGLGVRIGGQRCRITIWIGSGVVRRDEPRVGPRHSSVTGKSGGSCWISPSIRVCGSNSTKTSARSRTAVSSSVLPGQSPPIALM